MSIFQKYCSLLVLIGFLWWLAEPSGILFLIIPFVLVFVIIGALILPPDDFKQKYESDDGV